MTRVLYICPSSGIGGAETFIRGTCQYGSSEKYQNHYLLFSDGPLAEELAKFSASVTILDFKPRLSHISSRTKVANKIIELINKHNINLVHSTMAYGAIFAAWACWRTGTKHIWFQHGPASGWMDQVAASLPHHALITNSQYTLGKQKQLEQIVSPFISRKRKLFNLTLGTEIPELSTSDVDNFRQKIIRENNLSTETILVSMLCRIQQWKGVHIFIEALKTAQQKNENIVGLIWGESFKDEGYLNALKENVEQNNLKVIFMGPTRRPQMALAASDILVNASIQPEPFGLSIIEAMAVGTPVVVPNEGGPSEIVDSDKTGFIFEARNANDLADNILKLAHTGQLSKMSEQCIAQARDRFNIKSTIKNLEELYTQVLQVGSPV